MCLGRSWSKENSKTYLSLTLSLSHSLRLSAPVVRVPDDPPVSGKQDARYILPDLDLCDILWFVDSTPIPSQRLSSFDSRGNLLSFYWSKNPGRHYLNRTRTLQRITDWKPNLQDSLDPFSLVKIVIKCFERH